MQYYYKVFKSTKTGQELQRIRGLWLEFEKQLKAFCEKYAIKASYRSSFYLCDLSSVAFENIPEDLHDNWKKGPVADSYTLKVHPKNKALLKDWQNLRDCRIKRSCLDIAIGGDNPFVQAGFSFDEKKDFILFIIGDNEGYNIPEDCIEISNLEYMKLVGGQ